MNLDLGQYAVEVLSAYAGRLGASGRFDRGLGSAGALGLTTPVGDRNPSRG